MATKAGVSSRPRLSGVWLCFTELLRASCVESEHDGNVREAHGPGEGGRTYISNTTWRPWFNSGVSIASVNDREYNSTYIDRLLGSV
jgi:hypothetical protein